MRQLIITINGRDVEHVGVHSHPETTNAERRDELAIEDSIVEFLNTKRITPLAARHAALGFAVSFVYDEPTKLWEVFVSGATSATEALQGFNAVVLTSREATPKVACNRAELQPDGRYKISVGVPNN